MRGYIVVVVYWVHHPSAYLLPPRQVYSIGFHGVLGECGGGPVNDERPFVVAAASAVSYYCCWWCIEKRSRRRSSECTANEQQAAHIHRSVNSPRVRPQFFVWTSISSLYCCCCAARIYGWMVVVLHNYGGTHLSFPRNGLLSLLAR